MNKKFAYNGIEGEVRRATVRDDLHREIIERRLVDAVEDGAIGYWALFARLISQTVNAQGMPFDPATLASSTLGETAAAYDWFMSQDKGLKDVWVEARVEVDKPLTGDSNGPN